MKLKILIASLLIGVSAFAAEAGGDLFQKATTLVRAGNLEEAIKLYQRVATEFASSDRALAAKALVAEAKCYETLGQDKADKATKLYEQVAKDFSDQTDSARAASARLVVLRHGEHAVPATMAQHKIELPNPRPDAYAPFDTDGQHVVFKDDATGALMMSDLAGRGKRVVFKPKEAVDQFGVSRDFSWVYMRLAPPDATHTFAVVRTDGTGFREIPESRIPLTEACQFPPEFSWDNRSILLCQRDADGSIQLVRVSIASGEIHKVREADGRGYRFSPDGRFISYNSGVGKIFVIPTQGGEPRLISDHGSAVDWTRDGRYLVVSDVSGTAEAFYLLPIKEGQRAGDPFFVRYGDLNDGRTVASGAFIYSATPTTGVTTPWFGKLDPATGSLAWEKLNLAGSNALHTPSWSPDGAQISYIAANVAAGQVTRALRLHNIASGEDRELYQGVDACFWSAKHPSLFCLSNAPAGARQEAFSISTDTGRVEPLGPVPDAGSSFRFLTRDDRAIYGMALNGLVRWEIGASQWITVSEGPDRSVNASPDERWITRYAEGKIEIRPMSGGDWRPLVSTRITPRFIVEGNWLFYNDRDAAGKDGLYRVATAGGQPQRLGDLPFTGGSINLMQPIRISPDGQRFYAEARNPEELWMLENFEPKQQAAK